MKKVGIVAGVIMTLCTFGGCSEITKVENGYCIAFDKVYNNPTAKMILDSQDPHSAIGILYADSKSVCVAGMNADQAWIALVVSEFLALAQKLPGLGL